MRNFQIIALPLIGLLFSITLFRFVHARESRLFSLGWLIVWVIAGAAVAFPEVTTLVAKFLGIDRGADLVLYCAVLAGMIGFLFLYRRGRRLEMQLTLLVRHLALDDAKIPDKQSLDATESSRRSPEKSSRE